jgi:hypothetical protein
MTMKWSGDLLGETAEFESRWMQLRRQLQRLLVVAFLCMVLVFLALHPGGRRFTSAGLETAQTVWHWTERQFVHSFGPALILRLRAQWAFDRLEDEMARLQTMERRATRMVGTLNGELPQLLAAQDEVYQEILALTVELQHADALAIVALHTDTPTTPIGSSRPANVSAQVLTYIDLAEQVERRRQAVRVLTATLGQSRALQQELQQLITDAEVLQNLFAVLLKNSKGTQLEPGLTAGELLALRTAFQLQITRAQEIRNVRHTLEVTLAALNLPTEHIGAR